MAMGYKEGVDRNQRTFLPPSLDEYVGEENMCRVIDLFVNKADLAGMGFKYAEPNPKGQRSYSPWSMSKLYLYGYQNRVRSSRRLERETQRNVEVMWLMEGLQPDDKTISNFLKDNAKALKQLNREFARLCIEFGLVGKEIEAVDGTKIKANCSRRNYYTSETGQKALGRIDKKIDEYQAMLEENDRKEMEEPKPDEESVKEALKKLREKRDKVETALNEMEESGADGTNIVDRDAKLMKKSGSKDCDMCYNLQLVVDDKHGIIVESEVTDSCNDINELSGMCAKAAAILGTTEFKLPADSGYCNGAELKQCEEMGVTCLVPKPAASHQPKNPDYCRDKFVYDEKQNCYICPAGNILSYVRTRERDGFKVYGNRQACKNCPMKNECTKSKTLREIERSPNQEYIDRADARVKDNKALYRRRQVLSEPPNGVIKSQWGFDHFLCRGKEAVSGEASLMTLAYNMVRAVKVMGVKAILAALAQSRLGSFFVMKPVCLFGLH